MQIKINVSNSDLANLITSALEGGSNYWAEVVHKVQPTKMTHWCFTDGKDKKAKAEYLEEYVMNEGGSLTIRDTESEEHSEHVLTLAKAERGLQLMADKFGSNFADVLRQDTDANTGDVWLQLALFGDVIYG